MSDFEDFETDDLSEHGEGMEGAEFSNDEDLLLPEESYEPPGIEHDALADQRLSDECESLIMSLDTK